MSKKELTISEFKEIIKEEAIKLKKRVMLENEKRELELELKYLSESMEDFNEIDEGVWDKVKGVFGYGEDAYRKQFEEYAKKYKLKYTPEELEDLVQQMVADKGEGYPGRKDDKMIYIPSKGANPHGAGNIAKW